MISKWKQFKNTRWCVVTFFTVILLIASIITYYIISKLWIFIIAIVILGLLNKFVLSYIHFLNHL